jgi:hypothetical protein
LRPEPQASPGHHDRRNGARLEPRWCPRTPLISRENVSEHPSNSLWAPQPGAVPYADQGALSLRRNPGGLAVAPPDRRRCSERRPDTITGPMELSRCPEWCPRIPLITRENCGEAPSITFFGLREPRHCVSSAFGAWESRGGPGRPLAYSAGAPILSVRSPAESPRSVRLAGALLRSQNGRVRGARVICGARPFAFVEAPMATTSSKSRY